jgi:type II secretory pathway pseudopilin PulG
MKKRNAKRRAFSLTELIVIISALTFSAAVVAVVGQSVRQKAQDILCRSNLREMGALIQVYSADNDGTMVSNSRYTKRWWDLLGEYYGAQTVTSGEPGSRYDIAVFKCPVEWEKHARDLKEDVDWFEIESIALTSMYGYNIFFTCPMSNGGGIKSSPQYWFSRLGKVKDPSTLPLFWDCSSDFAFKSGFNGDPHMSLYEYGWDGENTRSYRNCKGGPAANHPANINALFSDGHAGANGLWMYEATLDNPEKPDYYLEKFHPLRALIEIGDGW